MSFRLRESLAQLDLHDLVEVAAVIVGEDENHKFAVKVDVYKHREALKFLQLVQDGDFILDGSKEFLLNHLLNEHHFEHSCVKRRLRQVLGNVDYTNHAMGDDEARLVALLECQELSLISGSTPPLFDHSLLSHLHRLDELDLFIFHIFIRKVFVKLIIESFIIKVVLSLY